MATDASRSEHRAPLVVYDHRERRSGVPQALARRGMALRPADLGRTDYVISGRLAVVRKADRDLASWQGVAGVHRALADVADRFETVVLVLVRDGGTDDGRRRSAVARIARRGIAVLDAPGAEDAAAWIARLARQEAREPQDGWRGAPGRKSAERDRLVEQLVAWLPGVSAIGARRLLEHFGSVRALATADASDIEEVRGFGPKRARLIAKVLSHRWAAERPEGNGRAPDQPTATSHAGGERSGSTR